MRSLIPAAALLIAGCAAAPQRPPTTPQLPQAVPQRGDLHGLTSGELVQRFGVPALQIREGPGLKLQFRNARCVLDAYLYPPVQGAGPERVLHVDARAPTGVDMDQRTCIALLQGA